MKLAIRFWVPIMRLGVASVAVMGLFAVALAAMLFGAGALKTLGGGDFASGFAPMLPVMHAVFVMGAVCWIIMWNFALFDVVLERQRVREAIRSAASRLFSQRLFWRLVAILVCAIVMNYVAESLFLVLAAFVQLKGMLAADVTLKSVAAVVVMPLGVIVMVLAYYDVRVRREGLDILQRIKPDMTVEHA